MYAITETFPTGKKRVVEQKIDGKLHSQFDEPSRVIYDINGYVVRKERHQDGVLHGENAVVEYEGRIKILTEDYQYGMVIKRVEYFNNVVTCISHWFNNRLHRSKGLPAVEYPEMGILEYYNHGVQYTPDKVEYKQYDKYVTKEQLNVKYSYKKITFEDSTGKHTVETYDSRGVVTCTETYLDAELHSFKDSPAIKYEHKSPLSHTKTLFYFKHGNPYMRHDRAAHVEVWRNDQCVEYRWIDTYRRLHNLEGPALINLEDSQKRESFYLHGKRFPSKEAVRTHYFSRQVMPSMLLHLFEKKYDAFDPNVMREVLDFS